MRFPLRDFTEQHISSSYQDVLQQYLPSDTFYVLDGYGNVVLSLPSSSIGQMLVSSDMTSSMSVATSSYSVKSTTSETSDFSLLSGESITSTTSNFVNYTYQTVISDFVVSTTSSIIYASASISDIIITMPTASLVSGRLFMLKKLDSSSFNIIITGSGMIEYDSKIILSERGSSVKLHSDSVQYWIQ